MRDDFPPRVKEAIARKAGYRCSNPDCGVSTAGGDAYIGKAAHISAASPGGARYDKSMTPEERKSESNGIHLCASCADKIDTDFRHHSVDLLRKWKVARSEQAAKEVGSGYLLFEVAGVHEAFGVGEITGLSVTRSARILPGTVVRAAGIGRVTGTKIGN